MLNTETTITYHVGDVEGGVFEHFIKLEAATIFYDEQAAKLASAAKLNEFEQEALEADPDYDAHTFTEAEALALARKYLFIDEVTSTITLGGVTGVETSESVKRLRGGTYIYWLSAQDNLDTKLETQGE